jgi:hypothetical protein
MDNTPQGRNKCTFGANLFVKVNVNVKEMFGRKFFTWHALLPKHGRFFTLNGLASGSFDPVGERQCPTLLDRSD